MMRKATRMMWPNTLQRDQKLHLRFLFLYVVLINLLDFNISMLLLLLLVELIAVQAAAVGQIAARRQVRQMAHGNGKGERHEPLGIGANGSGCRRRSFRCIL